LIFWTFAEATDVEKADFASAPASAPLLSYALIASIPLFLNLLSQTPPHSSQTGDSNLVASKTIDSSRKKKGAVAAGPGHR